MKTKKESLISFRLTQELENKLIAKTIKESTKRNKIIKLADIIREILEKGTE